MKNHILLLLFLICSTFNSFSQSNEIEQYLNKHPDINYRKLNLPNSNYDTYELKIKQPLDHRDTTKGYFYQKVYLNHIDSKLPTIIVTEGYGLGRNNFYEITKLLKGNQIDVEHRYYGQSLPDSLNYDYLNLEQASADLHRIRQLFKDIYIGKWLSTGISKGGTTAVYYKYYYPKDVDASIAYVAPLANSTEDNRIYHFLDTIGSNDCREKIEKIQFRLLDNRDKIIPVLKSVYKKNGREFTYLNFEEAFEISVLEYSFAFWQYGKDCDKIPTDINSIDELIRYYISLDPMSLFSDAGMKHYGSHYYQAATEMGYYGYNIEKFKTHLKALPTQSNISAIFPPNKLNLTFNSGLVNKLNNWLNTDGNNIIYIYGAIDTWSACAITPSQMVNSKVYFLKNKHHGNARIAEMSKKEKKDCMILINKWLEVK